MTSYKKPALPTSNSFSSKLVTQSSTSKSCFLHDNHGRPDERVQGEDHREDQPLLEVDRPHGDGSDRLRLAEDCRHWADKRRKNERC
jgi:hypothetical protein